MSAGCLSLNAATASRKRAAGCQLGRVQWGLMPDDWKSMTTGLHPGDGQPVVAGMSTNDPNLFVAAR